jgi:hypothetical protein
LVSKIWKHWSAASEGTLSLPSRQTCERPHSPLGLLQNKLLFNKIPNRKQSHLVKYKHITWARSNIVGLRHYATSRKIAGSIPDEVIGIFSWPISSTRTMALGSIQLLIEMSTRKFPGGKGRPARKVENLTAICEPIVWICGSLDVSQPYYRGSFIFMNILRQLRTKALASWSRVVSKFCAFHFRATFVIASEELHVTLPTDSVVST